MAAVDGDGVYGGGETVESESSRPQTTTSEKAAEETSVTVMARVMSATNKRIDRLVSAGSRPSTRGGSAAPDYDRDAGPYDTPDWVRVSTIVTDVCTSWKLSEGWKFCIKQLGNLDTKYLVEAIFSIPTRRRPVPTATASVLFAVDMGSSGEGSEQEAEEILFSVETQDLIHNATHERFSEQWLYDVVAAKRLTHDLATDILGPGPVA